MIKVIIHRNTEHPQDFSVEVTEDGKIIQDIHITPDFPPYSGEIIVLLSLLQNIKDYTLEIKEF